MKFEAIKSKEYDETIKEFSKSILPLMILAGLVLLFFELRRLEGEFLSFSFVFHSCILFGLIFCFSLRKKLSSSLIVLFVLVLLYSETLYSLFFYGFEPRSLLGLSYLCIFMYFFFGKKPGYLSLMGVSLLILLKGNIIQRQYLELETSLIHKLFTLEFWMLIALAFFLYPIPLLFLISQVKDRLKLKVEELSKLNAILREEITRREISERKVEELEDIFRSMVKSPLAGFFFLHGSKFLYTNKKTCEILGLGEDQIVGKDFLEFLQPEDRNHFLSIFTPRSSVSEMTLKCISNDGRKLSLLVSITPIIYAGEVIFSGIMIDITREKNLEAEIMHAQKMEAIGTLTQGIYHDFNNVLTAISGYASLILEGTRLDDQVKRCVEGIISSCGKAKSLIRDLLIFGRKDPLTMKETDLNDVVRDAEGLLRRLLTDDTELKISLSSEKLPVICDQLKIQQVLMNLATNAKDAMRQKKIVTITTELSEIDRNFINQFGYGKEGKYAIIRFSDTGCGMDDKVKERIFEPFFTTKEKGKGTGLGLSVAYSIIKQHNGYVRVESSPGKGTTFYIYLPIWEKKKDGEEIQ
ncbi:MAG: ATP-binding protein [Deltaproteobacteria bacterium]|nr:ATP-binding protein [Deltaproteobacteria bacterium]